MQAIIKPKLLEKINAAYTMYYFSMPVDPIHNRTVLYN